ncbi:MAG TPA: pyruvate ferredoxin oxidoreductase, partial [Armatimonadetes bacterium]|nr:pyruvate ferredoxin oxidoreductase [Armatimonadota bacterium]
NEAYMNTGVQRSSATPQGAHTTTSPAGEVLPGKKQNRKDLTEIMVAHDIPYVAQTIPGRWMDITRKAEKAFSIPGPKFMNVLTPCPLGWGHEGGLTPEISQLAADTCMWPLYEVEYGVYKITYKPKEKKPIEDFLKPQARFRHLFKGEEGEAIRASIQEWVDWKCEQLLNKAGA